MTEEEARQWLGEQPGVSRETLDKLDILGALIVRENERQNLVAPSSLAHIWSRHIVDSAQLVQWAPPADHWVDVGSGAGFPGLVVALLRKAPMLLVEPRRKRAQFLLETAKALDVKNVEVVQRDIRKVMAKPRIISARAVASLDDLFSITAHLAQIDTVYILPKGRTALEELECAHDTWQGVFHVKQSVTDPAAKIVIASNVTRKSG